jgi:hypothetical protein
MTYLVARDEGNIRRLSIGSTDYVDQFQYFLVLIGLVAARVLGASPLPGNRG